MPLSSAPLPRLPSTFERYWVASSAQTQKIPAGNSSLTPLTHAHIRYVLYSGLPLTKGRSRNLSIFGPGALLEEEEEQDVLLDRGGGKKASEPLILILEEKRHLQFFFVVFRFDVSSPPHH